MLLSADLLGIPVWDDQGPAPIYNAQVDVPPNDLATGAVQSIAVNPNNEQQIYIGTVNGGIWRTNNADPANPDDTTWAPLTDQHLSLAMGDIAFSPLDPTGNTLFAGTGSFSSLGQSGGPPIGILRTTDGGATWQNFAVNPAGENQVKAIVPTAIDLDAGSGIQQMVLVATVGGGGLYRSNDNGETFALLSGANGLPNADVSQLVADPTNPNRFYAGVANNGVYRGDFSAGVITWTAVNTGITNIGTAGNIQVAAIDSMASPGDTVLFALLSDSSATGNQGAFRSDDNGDNWTALATPPALFQRDVTVRAGNTIVIDPTDDTVVYIATYGGGDDIFRYDPSGAGSWVVIDNAGAQGGTTPHVDFRDLEFQGDDVLVAVSDGGIYFIENPLDAINNAWHAYIGDGGDALADAEIHNLAWDGRFDVIVAGLQDNGTIVQMGTDDRIWDHFQGGDGGDVQIDTVSLAGSSQSIRYASAQNMNSFTRYVFDSATNIVSSVALFPMNNLPANFTGNFVPSFELNVVNPAAGQSKSIVIGGGGTSPVYIGTMPDVVNLNTDVTWTAVPVAAGFGTVTALAFGGRLNGVDAPDILYAGTGNGLFIRTTAGGTLNATAVAFPGGGVTDVTLDPNDWQHAFVSSSTGVWETTDAGATWTNRTGNLSNTNLQTIEYAEVGDVDAILVGGLGGVFRMRTNSPGAWSEYGEFLPNAVAFDLDYDFNDNIVVVGTFGRGAWTIDNARDTLLVPGVLEIFGDEDGFAEDDTILLVREEINPSLLDVFINGIKVRTVQMSVLEQINIYGLGGNDILQVDSTNGLINVPLGIRYDGGNGNNDQLQLLQTDGPVHLTDTYTVGPVMGSGMSTIVGDDADGTQTVFFENLSPVLDLVPAAQLTVNATGADNAISYTTGLVAPGRVAVDEHEPIEFNNKAALVINAGGGSDTLSINNPVTPLSLTSITVNGGDPSSGDALIVTGVGLAVSVNTATGSITGATGAGGAVPITYTTIESLSLPSGIGNLTISTTGADDVATVTPGLTTGANSGTVESSGAVPQISFVNSGSFTANLGTGNDALIVNGSSNPDTAAVSGTAVAITGRRAVNVSGAESIRVNGQGGNDTFNVTPSATVGIFIDGGDPVGSTPGDLLNILAGGGSVTYNAGPETDEGSFVVGANQPVSFDHIESFGITGSGPVVINATNGPDAITVIARDATTHAAANGVRDFTVSVNAGPELLFIDVASLTVNALSGSDQVTLQTPAPNGAVWDVDVTVSGGPPADMDQLIVQTPAAGAETGIYTPASFDAGMLDLTSLSSLVTINTTEVLLYDGQGDNDSLTVNGTGGDDVFVHLPGDTDQAGNIQVNSLLALSYQSLGPAGSLTAAGDGGGDTLVVHGTAANDSFTVGTAGQVNLNSRVVLNVSSIETLTLEGFNGDDAFTLVPAISDSVYTTMNFNGGTQASAAGDRVFLIATAGDDEIAVSGQTVSLGGRTVQSSGVENIQLNALAGDDLLTYTGVVGITENINVSSAGIAGGGQLSAPDVTLVDFSGVERVDVHGNAPTPTETDTLTFSGTNANDVVQINLAADGTDADPILKLEDAAAATLLTLRNYTNFETLNVFGLDGEDVFNVRTDASGPSRNLFIDGGVPQGKKKQTDNLNIFYVSPRPHIIHSAATQDPDAGLVDLDYDTAQFLVQYDGIEQVVIRKE